MTTLTYHTLSKNGISSFLLSLVKLDSLDGLVSVPLYFWTRRNQLVLIQSYLHYEATSGPLQRSCAFSLSKPTETRTLETRVNVPSQVIRRRRTRPIYTQGDRGHGPRQGRVTRTRKPTEVSPGLQPPLPITPPHFLPKGRSRGLG